MVKGDKEAFLAIYHNHYRALFYYGFSLTADRELTKDCIQELFLDIWNTRPTLNKEVENIQSYLFTWLRRKISRTQSRLLREKLYERSGEAGDNKEFCYEELLIAFQQTEEKKEHLGRALGTLTKKQLEIIRLKFFDNLSYAEISEKTSLTTRTVYNIIYESIKNFFKFKTRITGIYDFYTTNYKTRITRIIQLCKLLILLTIIQKSCIFPLISVLKKILLKITGKKCIIGALCYSIVCK